jgi:hypothetical protein
MKRIILILSILILLLVSACSFDLDEIAEEVIKCDPPYIRHGSECCLDQNENAICDDDEAELPDAVGDALDDTIDDSLEEAIDEGQIDLSP